jgi:hypothetical protein
MNRRQNSAYRALTTCVFAAVYGTSGVGVATIAHRFLCWDPSPAIVALHAGVAFAITFLALAVFTRLRDPVELLEMIAVSAFALLCCVSVFRIALAEGSPPHLFLLRSPALLGGCGVVGGLYIIILRQERSRGVLRAGKNWVARWIRKVVQLVSECAACACLGAGVGFMAGCVVSPSWQADMLQDGGSFLGVTGGALIGLALAINRRMNGTTAC